MTIRMVVPLLVLAASACARGDDSRAVEAADGRLRAAGFSLASPADTSWAPRLPAGDSVHLVHGRTGAQLVAWGDPMDPSMTDDAFVVGEEALQEERLLPMEMLLSKHYQRVAVRQAECLRYDGVFRDHTAANPSLSVLALKGYACRHPADPGRTVRMEFSLRSGPDVPSELEALLRAADEVFASVEFDPRS
jgi:hypothetical protein